MDFPHESHEQKGKKQHTDLIGNEDKETWFRSPLDTKITTKKVMCTRNSGKETLPSHMCLNAKEAAAAVSSDILIPLTRISMTDGRNESPLDEASSHFE